MCRILVAPKVNKSISLTILGLNRIFESISSKNQQNRGAWKIS